MSQHIFTRGHVRVVAGWDRPLQEHFLTVTRGATVVYSNLTDPALPGGGGLTAAQVIEKLAALQIAPPRQLLDELLADEHHDTGNTVVDYGNQPNRSK